MKEKLVEQIALEGKPTEGSEGFDCAWPKEGDGTRDMTKTRPPCDEGLCCGKAKFPDSSNETVIEVCHKSTETRYVYQPPAPANARDRPERETWLFLCNPPDEIEEERGLRIGASLVAMSSFALTIFDSW